MKKFRVAAATAAAVVSAAALAVSAGAYHAYIGVQDTVYSFRNQWYESSYGRDAGNDCYNHMTMNGVKTEEDTYPEYEDNYDYDLGTYLIGSFTDVEFDQPGTYTVSVDDFDWTLDGATSFNFLLVSTDIPMSEGWVCTSASVIVDGQVAQTFDHPISGSEDWLEPVFENIWNPDLTDKYTGPYPTTSLAIEFTLDKEGAAAEEAAPAEETAAPAEEAAPAPAAGDVDAAAASTKGSPNTGIEDVAVVAGLALVAGAGIALTRKRK